MLSKKATRRSEIEDLTASPPLFEYFAHRHKTMESKVTLTLTLCFAYFFLCDAIPIGKDSASSLLSPDVSFLQEGKAGDVIGGKRRVNDEDGSGAAMYLFDKVNIERLAKGLSAFETFSITNVEVEIKQGIVWDLKLLLNQKHTCTARVINTLRHNFQDGIGQSEDNFELIWFAVDSTSSDIQMHFPALGLPPKSSPYWRE